MRRNRGPLMQFMLSLAYRPGVFPLRELAGLHLFSPTTLPSQPQLRLRDGESTLSITLKIPQRPIWGGMLKSLAPTRCYYLQERLGCSLNFTYRASLRSTNYLHLSMVKTKQPCISPSAPVDMLKHNALHKPPRRLTLSPQPTTNLQRA
jgi:hypothetical protein